jgi:flagellar motor switch protein FliN/FliY
LSEHDPVAWLTEEWTSRLTSSIEMMTEVRPGVKRGDRLAPGSPGLPVDVLWYAIPIDLTANAAIFVGATEENWSHIGKSALEAAGLTEISTADARGTYLEIINQATSGLAQAFAARIDKPVASLAAKEIKFDDSGLVEAALTPVDLSLGEPPLRRIYLGWSPSLEAELSPRSSTSREHADGGGRTAVAVKPRVPEASRTLDLLMEVELPVSVSFGRAELPLREVLKLNSGSIVELNRTISDPVEIIVNNCVIARGEVVVVEGNYGVRIHQVISREERLRTLK